MFYLFEFEGYANLEKVVYEFEGRYSGAIFLHVPTAVLVYADFDATDYLRYISYGDMLVLAASDEPCYMRLEELEKLCDVIYEEAYRIYNDEDFLLSTDGTCWRDVLDVESYKRRWNLFSCRTLSDTIK